MKIKMDAKTLHKPVVLKRDFAEGDTENEFV